MRNQRPVMILRTSVDAPDILIEDWLDSSLTSALTEMRDPSSVHYIPSQYLLYRALECTHRIINRNRILINLLKSFLLIILLVHSRAL